MPVILQEEEFSASLASLPEVQAFYCGTLPFEKAVAKWIKSPADKYSALKSMSERGTKVWLYWHPEGQLVGYGSLGVTS
jgi:hypothetical protein